MNIDSSSSAPLTSYLQQSTQTQKASKAIESGASNPSSTNASGLRVSDLERIQSYVNQLKEMPNIREEKVAQAKVALESGEYDKQEVIDTVANRLMGDL